MIVTIGTECAHYHIKQQCASEERHSNRSFCSVLNRSHEAILVGCFSCRRKKELPRWCRSCLRIADCACFEHFTRENVRALIHCRQRKGRILCDIHVRYGATHQSRLVQCSFFGRHIVHLRYLNTYALSRRLGCACRQETPLRLIYVHR